MASNLDSSPKNAPQFVVLLDRLINNSPKSQKQIADEVGYDKANMITMLKQNKTRLSLDRVPAMARALDQDPAEFLRLWMDSYEPGRMEIIEATLGMVLSKTERSWVTNLRKLSPGGLPQWSETIAKNMADVLEPHRVRETA